MRFVANGPSIPDELLVARDQGRVIFFCGAGVSRARAGLSDFFGLAEKVVSALHVPDQHPARKLIHEARTFKERTGASGIISADRIFGLLEKDFPPKLIEETVASTLKPSTDCDVSAHKICLDLATTREGVVRLVTTNFDRLFDACGRTFTVWQPPRLPDPARPDDFEGVVHLHGRADADYKGAEKGEFVLASSAFGRAYLSDGWATSFFRELIRHYVVVFVGYGADDPPIQYLLEALRARTELSGHVYAFQSGADGDAAALWTHKGVQAISYNGTDGHRSLWDSLEQWALRARNPDNWFTAVLKRAKLGPGQLAPHERGQVAHIASTYEGTKRISDEDGPLDASWLCVFDPHRRYGKPGRRRSFETAGPFIDPFDLFGLDSDSQPPKIKPDDSFAKRDMPDYAWDAFALNQWDRADLKDGNLPALRGHQAAGAAPMPPRLWQLGRWLAMVSDQPTAVWWAAHQPFLHGTVQGQIRWELNHRGSKVAPPIHRAWRFLFEAWERRVGRPRHEWHDLKNIVDRDGWDGAAIRQYAQMREPVLEVGPNFWTGPSPLELGSVSRARDLLHLNVNYPDQHTKLDIPDAWLAPTTRALRQNLELALTLELELDGFGLAGINPIVPDSSAEGTGHDRGFGLSGHMLGFCSLFTRLVALDRVAAKREFEAWLRDDDTIFARLRIWAAGSAEILSSSEVARVLTGLSHQAFWNADHQRDLLLVIAKRWTDLDDSDRRAIEERLLAGPELRGEEDEAQYARHKASYTLDRIHWLANNGCVFTFAWDATVQSLHSKAVDWSPERGKTAAKSHESRSGWGRRETSYSTLLDIPLSTVLSRAKELSGRSDNIFVTNDPFAGLSTDRPVRSLAALIESTRRNDFPKWAWETFLQADARKKDKAKLMVLIAERLARCPDNAGSALARAAASWIAMVASDLAATNPCSFERVIQRTLQWLERDPQQGVSGLLRGSKAPEWYTEAINAPAGKIGDALMDDPRVQAFEKQQGFAAAWLGLVEKLLKLPGVMRRHALAVLSARLHWFYWVNPSWTEEHLLSALSSSDDQERDAAWAGFLFDGMRLGETLYMRVKSDFLRIAVAPLPSIQTNMETFSAIILSGWAHTTKATGQKYISNEELHEVLLNAGDEFRSRVLWHAEQWARATPEDGGEEWRNLLPEFLGQVWPRQLVARSSAHSARLFDVAVASRDRFQTIVTIILPMLTKVDGDHLFLPELKSDEFDVVAQFPKETLALLDAVLPDDPRKWPYGIETTLNNIEVADKSITTNQQFIALKHRWSAR